MCHGRSPLLSPKTPECMTFRTHSIRRNMILVLGATGTSWSKNCPRHKNQGVPVNAASRGPRRPKPPCACLAWPQVLKTPPASQPPLKASPSIFLLTPPGTMQDLAFATAALDAVKGSGVKKIVYLSALGAEQNESSAQYKIEAAIKASGITYVILRPSLQRQEQRRRPAGLRHQGGPSSPFPPAMARPASSTPATSARWRLRSSRRINGTARASAR